MTKKPRTQARRSGSEAELGLLERAHNLFAVCRDGEVCSINSAGAEMLGYKRRGNVLGKQIADFFQQDYRALAEVGLEAFAEDEGVLLLKFVRRDDVEVDVEMWVSRLEFEGAPAFLVEARDITAPVRSAQAVRDRELKLEGILSTVADGIITVDAEGSIETFNPAAEAIFGFRADEVVGRSVRILMPGWVDGGALTFTGIVRDITDRKREAEEIRYQALHDPLTGLPNRRLLIERLEEAVKRARRRGTLIALMFVDLDKFKSINDRLGHAAGDTVLIEIAARLKANVRASDTVARVGGDEFVVILEELRVATKAAPVAANILELLETPIRAAGEDCVVGASIGIGVFPEHARDVAGLLECADSAMYGVKESGRHDFRFYGEEARADA
jgi:diguanylate cyclase (GGDEF)-like protein/PAS domain S-box-containing protein